MIYKQILRQLLTLNIESTLQQTTLDRGLLALDAMQRGIVYLVTSFGYIHSIGSTVSSKHDGYDSLDGTSKVDISLFRKKSDFKILLLNDDDNAGDRIHAYITNGDKKDDNIGKLNAVSEEQGLTEHLLQNFEEVKEDTKDHYGDINDIDDDREDNAYNFQDSLLKVRKAARVSKYEGYGNGLHDVKDNDIGVNRRRFAKPHLSYLNGCCWRWW